MKHHESVWACHGCKDIFFALLFYCFLISNFVLCIQYKDDDRHVNISTSGAHVEKYAGIALGLSFATVIVWICIMWACARCMIYFAFAICIFLLSAVGVYSFSIDYWAPGIVFIALAVFVVGYFFCIRSRINLATRMIDICAKVMFLNPFIFGAAFAVVCLMVGYVALILATAIRVCGHLHYDANDDQSAWGMFFYFLFLGLWGLEVCRNVVHVTSCGVLGQWYFNSNNLSTIPCLIKALTTLFGSICFGSLFVAIIETIRVIVQFIKDRYAPDNCCCKFLFCCVDCCLACVQKCVEVLNSYAYVHVAVYGTGFCTSARSAISFLSSAGLTAIINDDIVSKLIFVGSFVGGLCIGGFCGALGHDNNDFSEDEAWAWGLTFGISCYFFLQLMLSPLLSMVSALLVCFAEKPVDLHLNHPNTYGDLINAWKEVFPDQELLCVSHAEGQVNAHKSGGMKQMEEGAVPRQI